MPGRCVFGLCNPCAGSVLGPDVAPYSLRHVSGTVSVPGFWEPSGIRRLHRPGVPDRPESASGVCGLRDRRLGSPLGRPARRRTSAGATTTTEQF